MKIQKKYIIDTINGKVTIWLNDMDRVCMESDDINFSWFAIDIDKLEDIIIEMRADKKEGVL